MLEGPGPFAAFTSGVRAEWLDYNGHMRDASYSIVLSEANEEFLAALGLSADYRAATGASLYTVEGHIRYLAECSLGDTLRARTTVVAADRKRLRLYTEILRADGRVAVTGEFLYLHVDAVRGVTTDLPRDRYALVESVVSAHADLPRPAHLGAGIALSRPRKDPLPEKETP
jgi:acyl-CoA thioesterase FadM